LALVKNQVGYILVHLKHFELKYLNRQEIQR
jgi:hypothetical protein